MSSKRDLAVHELEAALLPVARALLRAGITGAETRSLLLKVFVSAAQEIAKLKNGKINQSRVAIMTGYSRTEIRKILTGVRAAEQTTKSFGARRLLDGWSRDPEFSTRTGSRKPLRIGDGYGSFQSLSKKYSGDIPFKAVLDELRRLGLVRVVKDRVTAASSVEESTSKLQSRSFRALCQQLAQAGDQFLNAESEAPSQIVDDVLEFSFETDALLTIAEDRARQSARAYMNGLSIAMGALATKKPERKVTREHRKLKVSVAIDRLRTGNK